MMLYYSTRDKERKHPQTFAYAVLHGLAPDGGLYLPETLPPLHASWIESMQDRSDHDIAFHIAKTFIEDEIPDNILRSIVEDTLNFDLPLVAIKENLYSLELYHGPTMAFKDVGARFMARVMGYFVKEQLKQEVKVIVATSGDTGSAVAAGFFGVEGIQVYILYPKGKVSPLQEKQLTTWGGNITAVEVNGSFDDCQALAKQLLGDEALKQQAHLSSANSINIARLIPQSFYYAIVYKRLKVQQKPMVVCVPSGNFGNIAAGLMLKHMGLPIDHFIAATNANDVFPTFIRNGVYQSKPSVSTISNAMDVGAPSNFERLWQIFDEDVVEFRKCMSSASVDDTITGETLKQVYDDYHYLTDPHGAVGFYVLNQYLTANPNYVGVFLETAHPAKFIEAVETILQEAITIPDKLQVFASKEKVAIPAEVQYDQVKEIIKTT